MKIWILALTVLLSQSLQASTEGRDYSQIEKPLLITKHCYKHEDISRVFKGYFAYLHDDMMFANNSQCIMQYAFASHEQYDEIYYEYLNPLLDKYSSEGDWAKVHGIYELTMTLDDYWYQRSIDYILQYHSAEAESVLWGIVGTSAAVTFGAMGARNPRNLRKIGKLRKIITKFIRKTLRNRSMVQSSARQVVSKGKSAHNMTHLTRGAHASRAGAGSGGAAGSGAANKNSVSTVFEEQTQVELTDEELDWIMGENTLMAQPVYAWEAPIDRLTELKREYWETMASSDYADIKDVTKLLTGALFSIYTGYKAGAATDAFVNKLKNAGPPNINFATNKAPTQTGFLMRTFSRGTLASRAIMLIPVPGVAAGVIVGVITTVVVSKATEALMENRRESMIDDLYEGAQLELEAYLYNNSNQDRIDFHQRLYQKSHYYVAKTVEKYDNIISDIRKQYQQITDDYANDLFCRGLRLEGKYLDMVDRYGYDNLENKTLQPWSTSDTGHDYRSNKLGLSGVYKDWEEVKESFNRELVEAELAEVENSIEKRVNKYLKKVDKTKQEAVDFINEANRYFDKRIVSVLQVPYLGKHQFKISRMLDELNTEMTNKTFLLSYLKDYGRAFYRNQINSNDSRAEESCWLYRHLPLLPAQNKHAFMERRIESTMKLQNANLLTTDVKGEFTVIADNYTQSAVDLLSEKTQELKNSFDAFKADHKREYFCQALRSSGKYLDMIDMYGLDELENRKLSNGGIPAINRNEARVIYARWDMEKENHSQAVSKLNEIEENLDIEVSDFIVEMSFIEQDLEKIQQKAMANLEKVKPFISGGTYIMNQKRLEKMVNDAKLHYLTDVRVKNATNNEAMTFYRDNILDGVVRADYSCFTDNVVNLFD